MPRPAIVWFRSDLRLRDNPALAVSAAGGRPVVPLFVHDERTGGRWAAGAASKWWLHHSLESLAKSLSERGLPLIVRSGEAEEVVAAVAEECDADSVHWNALYEPAVRERDRRVKSALEAAGLEAKTYNGTLLHHPDAVKTGSGGPYKVYSPFWRKLKADVDFGEPADCPDLAKPDSVPLSQGVGDLGLLPKIDWDGGFRETWRVGEAAASERLDEFLHNTLANYGESRNRPDWDGTSQLSPHLHFGEVGPRQVVSRTRAFVADHPDAEAGAETFLSEIGWREFAHHVLYHFPETPDEPLRDQFKAMPWRDDPEGLRAWQKGLTGYPIVDAGMRQLWHIGWMHNRVRMIVGSFLTKDQLISWERGAEWFFNTLVDGDLANNTLGWQWVSGCGADAAPFFRVFNPVSQGEKFDPAGEYVRRWVPELQKLPDRFLHAPWTAPSNVLAHAGVELGRDYPRPIVDHGEARQRALDALKATK